MREGGGREGGKEKERGKERESERETERDRERERDTQLLVHGYLPHLFQTIHSCREVEEKATKNT